MSVIGTNEPEFVYDGTTTGTGNFWDPCSSNVNNSMFSMRSDLPTGYLGLTNACNDSTLGHTTKFHVGFGPNVNWYADTGTPSSNQWDFRSVATHEMGHVTGFYGHFSSTSSTCTGDSEPANTMCPGQSYFVGTTFLRSLETHDEHTFLGAY